METTTPKISVIVPVYNAEQYLLKCIESILDQDYKHIELLLIDDGSSDNSGKICDDYAQENSGIRVFHKKNGGVSSARNFGLENALGKYIWFVDADDWIEKNCIGNLISELEKNDLDALQIGYNSVIDNLLVPFDNKYWVTTDILSPEEYVNPRLFIGAVCGTLFKRTLVTTHNIRFEENICLAEDQLFFLSIFKYSSRVKRINIIVYYYLRHDKSATYNSNEVLLYASMNQLINFQHYDTFQLYCDYLLNFLFLEWIKLPLKSILSNRLEVNQLIFYGEFKFYKSFNIYKINIFLYLIFGIYFIRAIKLRIEFRNKIKNK